MSEPRSLAQIVREHLESCPFWMPLDPRGTFIATALAGEAGELANEFKKQWRGALWYESDDRREKIVSELADVGNYALMLAEHLGVNLLDVCRDKLVEFEAQPEWEQLRRMRVTVTSGQADPLNAAAKVLAPESKYVTHAPRPHNLPAGEVERLNGTVERCVPRYDPPVRRKTVVPAVEVKRHAW